MNNYYTKHTHYAPNDEVTDVRVVGVVVYVLRSSGASLSHS